jgi:hypothetical protein
MIFDLPSKSNSGLSVSYADSWIRVILTLRCFAVVLPKSGGADLEAVQKAFQEGASRIVQYGGAKVGNRTMLDALLPAAAALSRASSSGEQHLPI